MERSFGTVISGNRRRKAELSPEQRTAIISKHESGHTPTKLACEFDCARSTIYDTLERFKQHNTVKSLPRSGRPIKISPRAARQIYQLARRNPNWSYLALRSQLPNPPCKSTIRSILIKYGLRKRRARKRIPLKVNSARARYRFALRWLRYRTWDRWIFSDECSVERHSKTIGSGSGWVWRFTSEAYRRDLVNIVPHVRDISQMVWAAIWLGGRSDLVVMERDESAARNGYTANSYIEALDEGLVPHYTPGTIFQQDNAKIHTANIVQSWFESHGLEVVDWPAHSPDMNPIEPVWRLLKLKVFSMFPELIGMGQSEADWQYFLRCLKAAWAALDQSKIDSLILSMPRRLEALRKARGWYTKY